MVSQLDLLLATLYRIVITHLSCPHFYNYAFVYFETGHYLQIGRYTHYNVCIFANLTEIIYNGTVKKCKILFVAQQR
uniref:Secreted protein n=1 Tax=Pyricularia oryzae (strain P131) TaxID=1143193 RepID=L7J2H7_PYRO1